ncbi:hypothetical protein BaRGS_00039409 [Batillaria attramentaria]|uniref:EGF-like domain-containing protein n=1 Tax=Batillaria attramentaria TaxID=370345 RepID=A0ABD0J344_9CAEN
MSRQNRDVRSIMEISSVFSPVVAPNGGACQTNNPCVRGTCFDFGRGAMCACPDGFYGNRCQHRMIHVECHSNGMMVNVFPYGYSPRRWAFINPPTLSNCRIPTVAAFVSRWPQFRTRGWEGFAGAFFHRNDGCAGNAVVTETPTSVRYTRDLNIFYGNDGRHFTDTLVRVTCIIPKATPTPSDPPVLPPCSRPPIGRRLLKPVQGTVVLWMTTADFPFGSLNWNFQCRVRTCTPSDNRCRMPPMCNTRRKRATRRYAADTKSTMLISSDFTVV